MNTKFSVEASKTIIAALSQKPNEQIRELIDTIQPLASLYGIKGETLRYFFQNNRQCYLVEEGSVALHRRGDGMVLISESAPFILGASNPLAKDEHLYVRTLENSKLSRLTLERFNLIVDRENLWKPLTHLLIMRILAHLRDAGNITLDRGILLGIEKLPAKY